MSELPRTLTSPPPTRESAPPPAQAQPLPSAERWVIGALLVFTLILRVLAAWRFRIDSDETQHLHVVWGWTRHLLQYRDVFDNHAPLFHLLMAPLLAILPERPETILWMRLAMIPFYALTLWCTYRIGSALFSERTGAWAAVIAGLTPGYFLCSTEFRPDDLWTVFWLLSLTVLASGKIDLHKSALAGLLLGATVATSLKTTLLLTCLGGAALATVIYGCRSIRPQSVKNAAVRLLAGGLALTIIPGLIVLFFALKGASRPFYYGVILHNLLPVPPPPGAVTHLAEAVAALLVVGYGLFQWSAPEVRVRRTITFLTAGFYIFALFTIWPLLEREHYLPFFPLLAVFVTWPVVRIAEWLQAAAGYRLPLWASPTVLLPFLIVIAELKTVQDNGRLDQDGARPALSLIRDALELTKPGEFVVDKKGETVFRPRAFFYVLESMTRARIRSGLMEDDTPQSILKTHACVAAWDASDFYRTTRDFLNENFVILIRDRAGCGLRVAGRWLTPDAAPGVSVKFTVVVPADYTIVDGDHELEGTLDGLPSIGSRFLAAGSHEFTSASPAKNPALVWSRAIAMGYRPFQLQAHPSSHPAEKKSRTSEGLQKLFK